MLKEVAGLSVEAMVMIKILQSLPKDDIADLRDAMRTFSAAEDDEAREAAALTIREILEQEKGSVSAMPLDAGKPEKWIAYVSGRIKELRAAAGMTQEQLAERSGLTQSHICRLERGEHSPNGLTLEKIAKGLGIPTSKIDPSAAT